MDNFFLGSRYKESHLLILGESAYSWIDKQGVVQHPSQDHCEKLIEWTIGSWETGEINSSFIKRLTLALVNLNSPVRIDMPTREQISDAWAMCAFKNYIEGSVGEGAHTRPSPKQWLDAKERWLPLLEQLKPERVLVVGRELWAHMPDTQMVFSSDVQAYKYNNGESTAWCMNVRHPAGGGWGWETLQESLSRFLTISLPND